MTTDMNEYVRQEVGAEMERRWRGFVVKVVAQAAKGMVAERRSLGRGREGAEAEGSGV